MSLPPPVPGFTGDLESLVGVWVERNYEGEPCTSNASGYDFNGAVCTRLELVKNADGTYNWSTNNNIGPIAAGKTYQVKASLYGALNTMPPGKEQFLASNTVQIPL